GSDMLFANCQSDLGEQAAVLDIHDPADQLVAATDLAESATTGGDVAALELLGNQTVDFAFGYAVVAAGRFRRADFAMVDPLLEGRIADAQNICGFTRGQQSLHGGLLSDTG